MAALSSCSEDGYWDQYSEADNKFSFQQSSVSYKYSSPDFPSTITVQITRDDSNGEATLPVTATTDAAGISCPSQVTFPAGVSCVEYPITVDAASIPFAEDITVKLAITDDDTSISGIGAITVSLYKDFTWNYIGDGVYTTNILGDQWPQPVYRAQENPQAFMLENLIATGYNIWFMLDDTYSQVQYYPLQATGYYDQGDLTYYLPNLSQSYVDGDDVVFLQQLAYYSGANLALLARSWESITMPAGWNN